MTLQNFSVIKLGDLDPNVKGSTSNGILYGYTGLEGIMNMSVGGYTALAKDSAINAPEQLSFDGDSATEIQDVGKSTLSIVVQVAAGATETVSISGTSITVVIDGSPQDFFIPDADQRVIVADLNFENVVGVTLELTSFNDSVALSSLYSPNDSFIIGTDGDDDITLEYTDADGDAVDANDNFAGNADDLIFAGAGNDTITANAGSDKVFGQDGDDVFNVDELKSSNIYIGGEGGETNGDTLDASSQIDDLVIDMTTQVDVTAAFVLNAGSDTEFPSVFLPDDTTIDYYGEAFIRDTGLDLGISGSDSATLEPNSGQDGTGQTAIYINDVLYSKFGEIRQGALIGETAESRVDGYFVQAYPQGSDDPVTLFMPFADQDANIAAMAESKQYSALSILTSPTKVDYSLLTTTSYNLSTLSAEGSEVTEFAEMENIITGSGNDKITGGEEGISISSGGGTDTIIGGSGADTIDGGGDNDSITSGGGNDSIVGGDGDDTVDGGDGNDYIDGGDGDNDLTGGLGTDTIIGGSGADTIDGGGDNDSITSGGGNDSIVGGDGDDTVDGGDGNDYIDGGDGDNDLTGGLGTDTIIGGSGADTIDGGGDNDSITSGGGNDSIVGGDGDDTIDGGDGNDSIVGGSGNDRVVLSGGTDTVSGGEGNDVFVVTGGAGTTNITDFDAGGGEGEDQDLIDLKNYYANLKALKGDFEDDGILNQSNTGDFDYSGQAKMEGGLSFLGTDGNDYMEADDFNYKNTNIPCFADTVMVMTDTGERQVGELKQGDLVLTLDSGYAPVRWIGHRSLDNAHFAQHPAHRPIRIRQGALGPNMPSRDLIVSPQHRVLVRSDLAQELAGQPEALVAAKHLLPLPGVTVADDMDAVTYVHIMFDQHEVVFSDGLATESFYTGDQAMAGLAPEARAEILAIFPELQSADFSKTPSARPFLDGEQGLMLAKAHKSEKRALLA